VMMERRIEREEARYARMEARRADCSSGGGGRRPGGAVD
jgi:hypothetical protein